MKTIKKNFETIEQAILFRTKLYEKWDFVKITDTPIFEEKGTYIFSVNNQMCTVKIGNNDVY